MTDISDTRTVRPQVLVGPMPRLVADLVRQALVHADAEVLADGLGAESLAVVSDREAPPVAVVVAAHPGASGFERDLLRRRPETVILRVEQRGAALSAEALYARITPLGELTAARLRDAISQAPTWEARG